MIEHNRLQTMLMGLENEIVLGGDESAKRETLETISEYITNYHTDHTPVVLKYYFCEFLNLVNIVLNIFLTHKFLGEKFLEFGLFFIGYLHKKTVNGGIQSLSPMEIVFPRITICPIEYKGLGAFEDKFDALCILAVNNINEKIYLTLWFLYAITAFLTLFDFILRLLGLVFTPFTAIIFGRHLSKEDMNMTRTLRAMMTFGDWAFLNQMKKYMDPNTYLSLVETLNRCYWRQYRRASSKNSKKQSSSKMRLSKKESMVTRKESYTPSSPLMTDVELTWPSCVTDYIQDSIDQDSWRPDSDDIEMSRRLYPQLPKPIITKQQMS